MKVANQDEEVQILFVGSRQKQWQIYRNILNRKFDRWDITLNCANSGTEALASLKPGLCSYNLVIIDDYIEDINGIELGRRIQECDVPLPLIILLKDDSNLNFEKQLIEVLEAGIHEYIVKDHHEQYLTLLPLVVMKVLLNYKYCIFRRRAQASMQEYREKFLKAFIMSPNAIFITSLKDGHIIDVNEAAIRQTGYTREELIGKNPLELGLLRKEDRDLIQNLIAENNSYSNLEIKIYNRLGEENVCLLSGHTITIGGEKCSIQTFLDITLRKKMQEEILKSRNLESIGILAGGIARDFNDYLTSIMGNISIAKMSLHDTGKIHRSLSRAEEISLKAADLASKLLTFSEGGEPIKKKNCISDIIRNTLDIHFRDNKVTIDHKKGLGLWKVYADDTQISQTLYNIILNAIQAMPESETNPEIIIRTENIEILAENEFSLKEGKYVKITIIDNGIGILEEDMNKIFDPFFSTKYSKNHRALGLGLSTCLSILVKHKGAINVESSESEGTTVTLYIPAYKEELSSSFQRLL